jgi:hypothetical protein
MDLGTAIVDCRKMRHHITRGDLAGQPARADRLGRRYQGPLDDASSSFPGRSEAGDIGREQLANGSSVSPYVVAWRPRWRASRRR